MVIASAHHLGTSTSARRALKTTRERPSFFAKLREAERARAVHDYGEHACAGDIVWASLSTEFVVRSISGTASRGATAEPRERRFRDLLSGTAVVMSSEEAGARLEHQVIATGVR